MCRSYLQHYVAKFIKDGTPEDGVLESLPKSTILSNLQRLDECGMFPVALQQAQVCFSALVRPGFWDHACSP